MKRLLKILTFVAPALILVMAGMIFGGGVMHRGDYAVVAGAKTDPPAAFTDGRPNLAAVMFYSAWCGSCAVLEPKLQEVVPGFDGRAVTFAKFDFSMGQPESLTAKATELGVDKVYLAHKGETGWMALVDRRDQRVIGRITMSLTNDQIRAEIEGAIKTASEPLPG